MARRGSSPSRGSSGFGRGRSPSPSARRAAPAPRAVAPAPKPAPAQVAQPTMAAPSAGGGMMANIASTAAGVAIGHTVGHALTGALMGGNHSAEPAQVGEQAVAPAAAYNQQPAAQNASQDPCRFELDQFLSCAQSQSGDLTLCDGFNQVLRECKTRYGGDRLYQ